MLAFATACPPSDLGPTCRFAGDATTACGKCIAAACQPKVNACCDDTTCVGYELPSVEKCSSSGDCADVARASASADPYGALVGCVKTSCADACGGTAALGDGGAGSRAIDCEPDSTSESCTCTGTSGDAGGNATSCGPSTIEAPATACCAGPGWPASGGCTCYPFRCLVTQGTDQCQCGSYYASSDGEKATSCPSTECCATPSKGECRCGGSPCGPDEIAQDGCDAEGAAKTWCGKLAKVDRCR